VIDAQGHPKVKPRSAQGRGVKVKGRVGVGQGGVADGQRGTEGVQRG
jgi:hypothetical protein